MALWAAAVVEGIADGVADYAGAVAVVGSGDEYIDAGGDGEFVDAADAVIATWVLLDMGDVCGEN